MASTPPAATDPPSPEKRGRLRVCKGRPALLAAIVSVGAVGVVSVAVCSGWVPQPGWLTGLGSSGGGSGTDDGDGQTIVKPAGLDDLSYKEGGRVDLGEFAVRVFDPATGNSLQITLRLRGTLVDDDQDAFWAFMSGHHRAFREQVAVTIRNCDVEDLLDPRLRVLKGKLVSRINRGLGRRLLKSVGIDDYKLYESLAGTDFVERRLPGPKPFMPPMAVYGPDGPAEATVSDREPGG
jgi:hypothetical protein